MQRNNVKQIALGGMLAAVAMVILCLGGLIPVATYVCPVLCCITAGVVAHFCSMRIAWAWYAAVSVLALLFAPDKESAMVFLALGYYPLVKRKLDCICFSWVVKVCCFNASIIAAYSVMIYLMGMDQLIEENLEFGFIGLAVLFLLGNITFILVDKFLGILERRL